MIFPQRHASQPSKVTYARQDENCFCVLHRGCAVTNNIWAAIGYYSENGLKEKLDS